MYECWQCRWKLSNTDMMNRQIGENGVTSLYSANHYVTTIHFAEQSETLHHFATQSPHKDPKHAVGNNFLQV